MRQLMLSAARLPAAGCTSPLGQTSGDFEAGTTPYLTSAVTNDLSMDPCSLRQALQPAGLSATGKHDAYRLACLH
jgi:hypothetical protein